jgi:hypothetical protein
MSGCSLSMYSRNPFAIAARIPLTFQETRRMVDGDVEDGLTELKDRFRVDDQFVS